MVNAHWYVCMCEWRRLYQSICVFVCENVRNGSFLKKKHSKDLL